MSPLRAPRNVFLQKGPVVLNVSLIETLDLCQTYTVTTNGNTRGNHLFSGWSRIPVLLLPTVGETTTLVVISAGDSLSFHVEQFQGGPSFMCSHLIVNDFRRGRFVPFSKPFPSWRKDGHCKRHVPTSEPVQRNFNLGPLVSELLWWKVSKGHRDRG